MCLKTYAWLPLCVLIWKRDRVCVRDNCLLYYKTVCKYFTSRSWTFDKKQLYKTAENRSIWDKSLIRRSPCKIAFVTTSGQDMCNRLLLHRQCAHLISQGLLMCFYFLFDLVKEGCFLKGQIVKHHHSSVHRKHNRLSIAFLQGSFFFLSPPSLAILLFFVFFATEDRTTPSLSCTDCEKCTYDKNLVHPRIFCMERNYLCEESISDLIEYLVILKMRLNTVNVKISAEKYYSSVSLE